MFASVTIEDVSNMAESQGGEIQDFAVKTDLLKILECPVCKEVPFPPIYTCTQGHMVCKQCIPKLTKCGLCKSALTLVRNFPLEEIIHSSTFTCKYKGKGCNTVIAGSSLLDHMKNCEFGYNFVPCNENCSAGCKGEKIRSDLFIEHLRNHHGIKYEMQKHRKQYKFQQVTDNVETGEGINSDYFQYDGRSFLIKWMKEKNLYFAWICVLGANEFDVECFTAEISIESKKSNGPALSWQTEVHTSDKSLEEIKETGCCVCIPEFQIKSFTSNSSTKIRGKSWKYNWDVRCRIHYKLGNVQLNELFHSPDIHTQRVESILGSRGRRRTATAPRFYSTTLRIQENPIMPRDDGPRNEN